MYDLYWAGRGVWRPRQWGRVDEEFWGEWGCPCRRRHLLSEIPARNDSGGVRVFGLWQNLGVRAVNKVMKEADCHSKFKIKSISKN